MLCKDKAFGFEKIGEENFRLTTEVADTVEVVGSIADASAQHATVVNALYQMTTRYDNQVMAQSLLDDILRDVATHCSFVDYEQ